MPSARAAPRRTCPSAHRQRSPGRAPRSPPRCAASAGRGSLRRPPCADPTSSSSSPTTSASPTSAATAAARSGVSPVLDRLAADGLRFTQGYANSPVCSPTRFALMTGRYQYRLRGAAEEPINSKSRGSTTLGLPPEHPTLPSLLKAAGYRTALIGKWHLGYPPSLQPAALGLRGVLRPDVGRRRLLHATATRSGTHDLWQGEEEHREEGYLTDLISRRAVDFIERAARRTARRSSSACTTPRRTGRGRRATTPRSPPRSRTTCSTCTAATSTPTAA